MDIGGSVVQSFPPMLPLDHRLFRVLSEVGSTSLEDWDKGLSAELAKAGVDYDRASTATLPNLSRYEIVVVPAFGPFDFGTVEFLQKAAANGTKVIVGPESGGVSGAGVEVLGDPSDLAAFLPAPMFSCDNPNIELHLFEGETTVLSAFNNGAEPEPGVINGTDSFAMEGIWTPESLKAQESVEITLDPWGVQVWEVSTK